MDNRDITTGGHRWRYHWLAEETGCDKQVVKRMVELLAILGACPDLPLGSLKQFRVDNTLAKAKFGVLAVSIMVSLEIASNVPGSGKFGGVIGPGQVAELDGMFALVSCHERVNKTGVVVLPRRPKTAQTVLGFEDGDIEGPLGLVMEE